jgi:chromosome segregation ATPase
VNKILLIILIVAAAIVGLLIAYRLELPFAVTAVDTIKEGWTNLTSGGIDPQTAVSGISIASAGASIAGLINQVQQKKAAITSAIDQSGLKDKALAQVDQLTQTKEQLLSAKDSLTLQLNEVTQIKDQALQEANAAKTQFNSLEETIKKQQQTIDTLHETLRRNKLSPDESIIQKVVT